MWEAVTFNKERQQSLPEGVDLLGDLVASWPNGPDKSRSDFTKVDINTNY